MPKLVFTALRYGWPYIGTLLAVCFAAWWLYDTGYRRCETREAVQQLSTLVDIKHAQQQVQATAPRSRADVIERLRGGTF